MSTTWHLRCDECRDSVWVGQTNGGEFTYYSADKEVQDLLRQFLDKHVTEKHGHRFYMIDGYTLTDLEASEALQKAGE